MDNSIVRILLLYCLILNLEEVTYSILHFSGELTRSQKVYFTGTLDDLGGKQLSKDKPLTYSYFTPCISLLGLP